LLSADQVISGVKDSKYVFSIQLDESMDVTNNAQLLSVYLLYTVLVLYLFSKHTHTHTQKTISE